MRLKKIIAFFVLIAVILMPVAVFADTTIPDPPSDVWEYWVVVKDSQGYIHLYASHYPITVSTSGYTLFLNDGQQKYSLPYGGDTWDKKYEIAGQGSNGFYSMHKSNHDIAYDDGSGFFFLRPKVLRLFPTAKTTDFGTILRNFSAGLIPLVGLIVSVICLKKGWDFLRNQLMH